MLRRILLILPILPVVELGLLLVLGKYLGPAPVLVFVVATAIAGAMLLRRQGWNTWRSVQRSLRAGELPTEGLADGLMILVAAMLLLSPGVLTDVIGLSLLIPYCRRWYRRQAMEWFRRRVDLKFGPLGPRKPERVEVIDSYVVPRAEDRN